MNANIMKCASKSFCDSKQKREKFCKDTLDLWEKSGITVRKCLYNCCSEDRCNGPHGSGFGSNHKRSPLITSFQIVSLVFANFLNY
ncbi:unnamed protein product [Porites lobata]|uniref:Uncharacterized protein n=1 Tax=Porites lobata TaxID=104759 RepID=A0ABN8QD21_9CNID|nr:unnamed protein product [Porites lobata]